MNYFKKNITVIILGFSLFCFNGFLVFFVADTANKYSECKMELDNMNYYKNFDYSRLIEEQEEGIKKKEKEVKSNKKKIENDKTAMNWLEFMLGLIVIFNVYAGFTFIPLLTIQAIFFEKIYQKTLNRNGSLKTKCLLFLYLILIILFTCDCL